jgi:hypothetical protein
MLAKWCLKRQHNLFPVRFKLTTDVGYTLNHESTLFKVLWATCVYNGVSRHFAIVMLYPKPVLKFLEFFLTIIL